MSLRDYLNGRLAGLDQDGADEVLEELGFDGLPADAFSTALLHFADQAPMDTADALAPIVTRTSPVPFESGDLPDHPEAEAILADGGDVFDLFEELAPAEPTLGSIYDDADPSAFDDGDPFDDADDDPFTRDEVEARLDDEEDEGEDGDEDEPDARHHDGPGDEDEDDLDDEGDGYGGGLELVDHEVGDLADEDDEDDEDEGDRPADELDDFDDLDELDDFDRPHHGGMEHQLHEAHQAYEHHDDHHAVDHHHDGDDPAEIGFDH